MMRTALFGYINLSAIKKKGMTRIQYSVNAETIQKEGFPNRCSSGLFRKSSKKYRRLEISKRIISIDEMVKERCLID